MNIISDSVAKKLRNTDGRKKTAMPVAFYSLCRLKYLVQNLEKIKGCVREKVK